MDWSGPEVDFGPPFPSFYSTIPKSATRIRAIRNSRRNESKRLTGAVPTVKEKTRQPKTKPTAAVPADGEVARASFSIDTKLLRDIKHLAVDENVSYSAVVEVALRRLLRLNATEIHSAIKSADATKRRR